MDILTDICETDGQNKIKKVPDLDVYIVVQKRRYTFRWYESVDRMNGSAIRSFTNHELKKMIILLFSLPLLEQFNFK